MRHDRLFVRSIGFAVLMLLFATWTQAQTTLRWKLKQGESLRVAVSNVANIGMILGDKSVDSKMTMATTSRWHVDQVATDGTATVTQQVEEVKINFTSPLTSFEFDSTSKTEPTDAFGKMIAKSTAPFAKAKFALTMLPNGEITEIKLSPETEKELSQQSPASGSPMNKESIVAMLRQTILPLPNQAVGVGESWKAQREVAVPPNGKMIRSSTLTYRGADTASGSPLEKIAIVTTSAFSADGPATIHEQTETGTILFDNTTGRLVSMDGLQEMTLSSMVGGASTKQTIKSVTKATVTRIP